MTATGIQQMTVPYRYVTRFLPRKCQEINKRIGKHQIVCKCDPQRIIILE